MGLRCERSLAMPEMLVGRDVGRVVGYVRGTRPGYFELVNDKQYRKKGRKKEAVKVDLFVYVQVMQ